jgi:hypothetical protein
MSTTWRTAPAFYRARYAALGSTLPLLPARKTSPTTSPLPLPARSSGDFDFAPQRNRTRRPLAATFLGRYPTHRCDKPKLRRRTLVLVACGVLAWCALALAPSSWSSKRAPRAYRSLLASSASRRQPRLVVLRPLTAAVGSRAAPPPEAEATAAALVTYAVAPPPMRTSLQQQPQRATLIAPEQAAGVLSGASRLALLHLWAAYAILGCVAAAAAASVAHGLLQRRRSVIERDDDYDDASESSDYFVDDEFDRESDQQRRAEGSSSSDKDLYRVVYSSDPAEIGYGYGSFGRWSPASTLVSVDARASAAAASSSSSPTSCASTWTGDYFDKFDV